MTKDFRLKHKAMMADLILYWREIEYWIKRAEQVNKRAVIPAINELRYASRQLINAVILLENDEISKQSGTKIRKHIFLAEQYLINADHDIVDSLTMYLSTVVDEIDRSVGPARMSMHYPEYMRYKNLLDNADEKIAAAREDYTKRREIYNDLRSNTIPELIKNYKTIKNSRQLAGHEKDEAIRAAKRYDASSRIMNTISIIASIITIACGYAMYETWSYSMESYCKNNEKGALAFMCTKP